MNFPDESREAVGASSWVIEPFLHVDKKRIFNPITDRTLQPRNAAFAALQDLRARRTSIEKIAEALKEDLIKQGWLVTAQPDLSQRFFLKYVEIESHTVCNQACYFCPVSIQPREAYSMPMALYEQIVSQLVAYRDTLQGVLMLRYNEPTADARFLDQVRLLKAYAIPVGLNTNATGLTPHRVDALLQQGGLRFLSVNLSSLDQARYHQERERDHLQLVMRNMNYMKDRPVAERMDIAVLGRGDKAHKSDYEAIRQHFAGSYFDVKYYEVMDRAGHLEVGHKAFQRDAHLCGCEQTGSRPLQWLHITPQGRCVLCCEDYDEKYVVGDLTQQTVAEVLAGPRLAQLRRWVYGLEDAPDDFICRKCIFARTGCGTR